MKKNLKKEIELFFTMIIFPSNIFFKISLSYFF